MSYDRGALLVSAASDNICRSILQALVTGILRPNGPRSGALDNLVPPSKLVISPRRKGPGAEADATCGSGELDTTHAPCNADPPSVGARFTAIWNSGAGCATLGFLVGGSSNRLAFGGQVFVASLRFWTHGKFLPITFSSSTHNILSPQCHLLVRDFAVSPFDTISRALNMAICLHSRSRVGRAQQIVLQFTQVVDLVFHVRRGCRGYIIFPSSFTLPFCTRLWWCLTTNKVSTLSFMDNQLLTIFFTSITSSRVRRMGHLSPTLAIASTKSASQLRFDQARESTFKRKFKRTSIASKRATTQSLKSFHDMSDLASKVRLALSSMISTRNTQTSRVLVVSLDSNSMQHTAIANFFVWIDPLGLERLWCHLRLDSSAPGLRIAGRWERVGNGTRVLAVPPWACITMMTERRVGWGTIVKLRCAHTHPSSVILTANWTRVSILKRWPLRVRCRCRWRSKTSGLRGRDGRKHGKQVVE